jgi:16S rRNA processing protein RimM
VLTNEPDAVFASGRLLYQGDVVHTVERSRPFKDAWLVKLQAVDDKTRADHMRGAEFMVPINDLAPPDENEVYLDELNGMRVTDETLGDIGDVAGWYDLPQGLVLEVRGPRRADVPFNEAFVKKVDRSARRIEVNLPDGLVE